MNLALIGHGAMGTEHLEVLLELGGVEPYIVAGSTADAVKRFAGQYDFRRAETDAESAITDPRVDLVVIASPNQVHAAQARTAIAAGKHVLIEIPVALNLADAEELAKLAEAASVTVMAGHTSRYYPAIRDLVDRIRGGTLHPRHIVSAMGTDKRNNRNWKGEEREWVDNLLWHHGLHVFDTTLHLFGKQAFASASILAGCRHPEHGGEMDLSVSLRGADGGLATIALTYHAREQFTRYTIIGDEDFLDFEQTLSSTGTKTLMQGGTFRDLIRHQDNDFLEACRRGTPSPIPISEIMPAMRLLDHLQRQIDEQREGWSTPMHP